MAQYTPPPPTQLGLRFFLPTTLHAGVVFNSLKAWRKSLLVICQTNLIYQRVYISAQTLI